MKTSDERKMELPKVQPLSVPSGLIFYFDFVYGNNENKETITSDFFVPRRLKDRKKVVQPSKIWTVEVPGLREYLTNINYENTEQ